MLPIKAQVLTVIVLVVVLTWRTVKGWLIKMRLVRNDRDDWKGDV
jgi:hypothetical protein